MKYFFNNNIEKKWIILKFDNQKYNIFDDDDNKFKTNSIKSKAFKYKYISEQDKKSAEALGDTTFWATLPTMGLNLGFSLILYFFS